MQDRLTKMIKRFESYCNFNLSRGSLPATLLKKRLWYRCFPMNFGKTLRTLLLTEYLRWLLLSFTVIVIMLNAK